MPSDGARLFAGYKTIDAQLVASGPAWHATSAPWMQALERHLLSGKRRLTVNKGRQSGGSVTMARVGVATALFGEHRLSAGTRGVVGYVSIKLQDANERLRNIAAILEALRVPFSQTTAEIELSDRPIVFRSMTCTVRERGSTMIALFEDEIASWRNEETGANPAKEVDAALTPALITQPNGRVYSISSPMAADDFHYELVTRGDTDAQNVVSGPSWYWNPTISEEGTRQSQPDERIWKREFAAIPGDAISAVWTEALIAPCFVPFPYSIAPFSTPLVLSDPSGLAGRDRWTACVAQWMQRTTTPDDRIEWVPKLDANREPIPGQRVPKRDAHGAIVLKDLGAPPPPFLLINRLGSWSSPFSSSTSGSDVCAKLATTAHAIGAGGVVIDQFASTMISGELERHGAQYRSFAHTNTSKAEGVAWISRLMREGKLKIIDEANPENVESFKSELRSFREKLGNGIARYEARTGRHDDWPALLLLAARASDDGLFGMDAPLAGGHGIGDLGGKRSGGASETTNLFESSI